ncbi:MAG: hypothetical protein ACRDQU_00890 [Pseudonocardiaceae bacterium]
MTSADDTKPADIPATEVDETGFDPELHVAYQRAGQVRQALAELRNAQGQGNTTRVEAAEKHLAGLGYHHPKPTAAEEPPAAGKPVDAKTQPPEGRSATPPAQIKTDAPATPTKVTAAP